MSGVSNAEAGKAGEDDAARFLIQKGFTILERNFRNGKYGEIDIIARKDNVIVFAEVKNRSTGCLWRGRCIR